MARIQQSFFQRHKRKLIIFLVSSGLLTLLAFGAVAIGYWMVVPDVAEQALRSRLTRLEADGKVAVKTGKIEPNGLQGVIIRDFVVGQPDGDGDLVRIEEMRVGIDRTALLAGKKVVSSLEVKGATVIIRRDIEGQINLEMLRERLRANRAEDDPEEESDAGDGKPGFLRYFGGEWPDVVVHNATLLLESKGEPFPIEKIETASLVLDSSGDTATFNTIAKVTQLEDSNWTFPREVTVDGTVALPLEQTQLSLKFDRPLSAAGLPPYPFLKIGLGDVELSDGGLIKLSTLSLATSFGDEETELFSANKLELKLERFTTNTSRVRPLELLISEPSLQIEYDAQGGSNLQDLMLAIRPPQPTHIRKRAIAIAEAISSAKTEKEPTEEIDPAEEEDAKAQEEETEEVVEERGFLASLPLDKLLRLTPDKVEIKGGLIVVRDARKVRVTKPSSQIELRDGKLIFTHDPESGALSLDAGFDAFGGKKGDQDRGGVSIVASGNHKTQVLQLSAKARALDLSMLSQLAGPKLWTKLQGGTLRAEFSIEQTAKNTPFAFDGDISLSDLVLSLPKVAEDPITDLTLGYAFKGSFDPRARIPEAKLLTSPLDANVPKDPNAPRSKRKLTIPPPTRGALVFTKGNARVGEVKASVLPAFYGLDRDKPLPARFDLRIEMPPTHVQRVFDAIPDALMGDLVGTKIEGKVKWNFDLEVPMYDASEMVWRGEPETDEFMLISMPDEVDVREMTENFRHTITDEKVLFERQVRIPAMNLTPTDWLMENAGLTLEQVDYHWRRGEWFPAPDDMTAKLAQSPEYWKSQYVKWQAAPLPWAGDPEGADIIRKWKPYKENQTKPMVSEPYGPYVYVPLHHISPWLIRAILTTEDNSFFKHDGFNRFALRQSIERNLAAGDYVRGASTISMQLIKNLYLTRKKVMARKIQEAFLVFLMESVVMVPKARILEIYFNIIEFGPGVFGIHDAAVHYFGKRPSELTLAECAWLVTIVPGPKRYHFYRARGEMTDRYFDRIKRYMKIMLNRERITQAEYDAAAAIKPLFHVVEEDQPALKPRVEEPPKPTLDLLFPGLFDNDEGANKTPSPGLTPTPKPTPTPTPIPLDIPQKLDP